MNSKVFIRTEGGAQIGMGHLYRSIALADILSPVFDVTLVLTKAQFPVFDLPKCEIETLFIEKSSEDWEVNCLSNLLAQEDILVVDSYAFNDSYYEKLYYNGLNVVYIDDQGNDFKVLAVLNHLIGADLNNYSKSKFAFLGPKYAILRREFLHINRKETVEFSDNNDLVLICLGGGDSGAHIMNIIQAFEKLRDRPTLHVVVGASFPHLTSVQMLMSSFPSSEIHVNISANQLIDVASKCDVAVCTPGMISYELFSMGKPILCGHFSIFQNAIVELFSIHNLVIDVGNFEVQKILEGFQKVNDTATSMVANQLNLFDGHSGDRLISVFKELANGRSR